MTDEKEIRDLLATYALSLDVDDFERCSKLFADDGEFLVYGQTLAGERIREMFTRAPRGLHLCGVHARRSAWRHGDRTHPDVVHRLVNP